jgi:hypothetical protein
VEKIFKLSKRKCKCTGDLSRSSRGHGKTLDLKPARKVQVVCMKTEVAVAKPLTMEKRENMSAQENKKSSRG